jgi:hypothetical protein
MEWHLVFSSELRSRGRITGNSDVVQTEEAAAFARMPLGRDSCKTVSLATPSTAGGAQEIFGGTSADFLGGGRRTRALKPDSLARPVSNNDQTVDNPPSNVSLGNSKSSNMGLDLSASTEKCRCPLMNWTGGVPWLPFINVRP